MQSLEHAFRAAAAELEEDIRRIDAGEINATPARRAFLAGAIRAWKRPAVGESGGFPVDGAGERTPDGPLSPGQQGPVHPDPENSDLADTRLPVFDGGEPTTIHAPEQTIDGGMP